MNAASSVTRRPLARLMVPVTLYMVAALACFSTERPAQAQALSAGIIHTCAIDGGHGVQCWGGNSAGQLGDGSTIDRARPARVASLDSGFIAVAATSAQRSCALRTSGEVLCWGLRFPGMPAGTPTTPVPVSGLGPGSGVIAIALGTDHACALKSNGIVACWGSNFFGQVGNGTTGGMLPPSPVIGLTNAVAIAAGTEHTCAVKADQSVYCWGRNFAGALGDGTSTDRNEPTAVTSLGAGSGIVGIGAGYGYTCAKRNDGAAFCWGFNAYGQLGDGTTTMKLIPTLVQGIGMGTDTAAISGIYYHSCARTGSGAAYCWGNNGHGQLGDGTTSDHSTAVPVLTLGTGVEAIATGGSHSCAIKDGVVYCWGANASGQLGNGTYVETTTPMIATLDKNPIFIDGFDR